MITKNVLEVRGVIFSEACKTEAYCFFSKIQTNIYYQHISIIFFSWWIKNDQEVLLGL